MPTIPAAAVDDAGARVQQLPGIIHGTLRTGLADLQRVLGSHTGGRLKLKHHARHARRAHRSAAPTATPRNHRALLLYLSRIVTADMACPPRLTRTRAVPSSSAPCTSLSPRARGRQLMARAAAAVRSLRVGGHADSRAERRSEAVWCARSANVCVLPGVLRDGVSGEAAAHTGSRADGRSLARSRARSDSVLQQTVATEEQTSVRLCDQDSCLSIYFPPSTPHQCDADECGAAWGVCRVGPLHRACSQPTPNEHGARCAFDMCTRFLFARSRIVVVVVAFLHCVAGLAEEGEEEHDARRAHGCHRLGDSDRY